MNTKGRRHFLKVVAGASTSVFAFPACSSDSGSAPANVGDIDAGSSASLTVGTLKGIAAQPVCIGRDAQGVYAMTLTCTHEACNMARQGTVSSSGITCTCHGSVFDVNGNVTRGPAKTSLSHFAVSVDASGNLTVHTGQVVEANTRLTLPA